MIEDLKTFIETYKDLINNKAFGSQLFSEYYGRKVWIDFLELLEKLHVDPLARLRIIPTYFYQNSKIDKIDIPNYITSIGSYAFYRCMDLINVAISNNITSIGRSAFAWCDALTNIAFNGTKEQWNNIEKGKKWKPPLAKGVKCLDGMIKI